MSADGARFRPYLPAALELFDGIESPASVVVDASLLLLDISGFTPLSERLAKLGVIGAEALTDIMSNTFGQLLGISDALGGDLVKFGGDALLVSFRGDGHEARALTSADLMRSMLTVIGAGTVEGVTYRLGASYGVASGAVTLAIIGADHRELMLWGDTVDRVQQLEAAANRGRIYVDAATRDQVTRASYRRVSDGTWDLRSISDIAGPAMRRPDGSNDERAVPVALRSVLGTASADGEHRNAAIGFVRFRFALGSHTAPLDAAHRCLVAVQRACASTGVTFLSTDVVPGGFKTIVVAGVPNAMEELEGRLGRTLSQILAEDLPMRAEAGATVGRIFAGDVGSASRQSYTILGDDVNLAARLMASAAPNELRVTASGCALMYGAIAEPIGAIEVKGKRAAVDVVRITGFRSDEPELDLDPLRYRSPATARDAEERLLDEWIQKVATGEGGLAQIIGDAGIGKTTMLHAVLEPFGELKTFRTFGSTFSAFDPYLVCSRVLRAALQVETLVDLNDLMEQRAPQLMAWRPLIARALRIEDADTAEVERLNPDHVVTRLRLAVSELLDAVVDGPSLFVIDDAQLADEASIDLMTQIVMRGTGQRFGLLLAHRPETRLSFQQIPDRQVCVLGPLTDQAVQDLAQRVASRQLREFEMVELVERSAGNPLFAIELAGAVGSQGLDGMPDAVEAVLAARIDGLAPDARELLRELAVFGTDVPLDLVTSVLGPAKRHRLEYFAQRALREFVTLNYGGIQFRLPLVRDAAYNSLRISRRRELHRQAAHDVEPQIASLHLLMAGEFDQAFAMAMDAATHAERAAAPVVAARLYLRARDALTRSRQASAVQFLEVAERLGSIALRAGLFDEAATALREAIRIRTRTAQSSYEQMLLLAIVRERQGQLKKSRTVAASALRSARDITNVERRLRIESRLLVHLAGVQYRLGNHAACQRLCSSSLAGAVITGDDHTLGHAFYLWGTASSELGNAQAATVLAKSIAILRTTDDDWLLAFALNNLGVDEYFRGNWIAATDCYEQSRAAAERSGDRFVLEATAWNNIGEIYADQGQLDEAEVALTEAARLMASAPYPMGVVHATMNLGRVAARRGDIDEARRLLGNSEASALELGLRDVRIECRLRRVEVELVAGDVSTAASMLKTLMNDDETERATQLLGPALHRLAGVVAARVGDIDEASDAFARSVQLALDLDAPFEAAISDAARCKLLPGAVEDAATQETFDRLGVVNPFLCGA